MTSRSFVFTYNNPDGLLDFEDMPLVRYAIYQGEVGELGTYHYQGYIELKESRRVSYMSGLIPGAHFEPRRGTAQQAKDYASKEDTRVDGPYEYGVFQGEQGKRSDLEEVKEMIDLGASDQEIADAHFGSWVRYYKSFGAYRALKCPVSDTPIKVSIIIGPTGTGKTLFATKANPTCYFKQHSKWWDLYASQDTIIFDDFYGWYPYSDFLRVLDRYSVLLETKGGQVWRNSKELIITSNTRLESWYKHSHVDVQAIARRVHKWYLAMSLEQWYTAETHEEFLNLCNQYDFNK